MKYTKPVIDILLFDEDEILTASVKDYAQGQAVKFMLQNRVGDDNSDNNETSSMIGVDVRQMEIKALD